MGRFTAPQSALLYGQFVVFGVLVWILEIRAAANLLARLFTSWERNAIITGDLGSMFLFRLKAFDPFRGKHY